MHLATRVVDGSLIRSLIGVVGIVDVGEPALGGRGHGHGSVELGLVDVVGDQREECGVAVLLELALYEVGAAAALRPDVGDADAFCRASGVVGCRFAALRWRWPGVFLGGSPMLVLSSSFAHDPLRRQRKARRDVVLTNRAVSYPADVRAPCGANRWPGARLSRIGQLRSTRLRRRTDTPRAYLCRA